MHNAPQLELLFSPEQKAALEEITHLTLSLEQKEKLAVLAREAAARMEKRRVRPHQLAFVRMRRAQL